MHRDAQNAFGVNTINVTVHNKTILSYLPDRKHMDIKQVLHYKCCLH